MFTRVVRSVARAASFLGLLMAAGCFTAADGRQPAADIFYFPTGLVTSPGRTTLYVANSDFDLAVAGGSVQALDLAAIRRDVRPILDALAAGQGSAAACQAAGRAPNADTWLNPGPCSPFGVAPYVRASAFIGAFASGLLLVHEPDGPGARLFVPVRGDPSVTYFDVDDDRGADSVATPSFSLRCDQDLSGFCAPAHRVGQDPDQTLRGIQLPADPVGLDATADGTAIVVAHQTQSAASLLVNDWRGAPELAYFTSGLAPGPTEVSAIPEPAFVVAEEARAALEGRVFTYRRGFTITHRSASEVEIVRHVPDDGAVPPRPFIVRASSSPVAAGASGFDSRGMAILDTERRACEATCSAAVEPVECLMRCAEEVPLKLFLANRNPASLLIGEINTVINRVTDGDDAATGTERATSAFETLFVFDSLPLDFGASRVEIGQVVDADGRFVERVFAVCFDSRRIFVVDPVLGRVETVIRTGRGPHDIAVDNGVGPDGPYSHLIVGHFTDSYLGVADLDLRRPQTYGQIVANIGTPRPPQETR